jgi:hypothetical protein
MEKCRLCLKENELCKSHIFPEFMYENTYDDNSKFFEFNLLNRNKYRSKGFYEKLLCRNCEDRINVYETYAHNLIYNNVRPLIIEKRSWIKISEYNYDKFKLFVLSLIWRCSISTLDFFESVSLGKYEEELRNILLNQKSTPVNYFPCTISQTHINHKMPNGFFLKPSPYKTTYDDKTIYQFFADGIFFYIGLGSVFVNAFPNGSSVSPKSLRIGYSSATDFDDFMNLFVDLKKGGKFRVYETRT